MFSTDHFKWFINETNCWLNLINISIKYFISGEDILYNLIGVILILVMFMNCILYWRGITNKPHFLCFLMLKWVVKCFIMIFKLTGWSSISWNLCIQIAGRRILSFFHRLWCPVFFNLLLHFVNYWLRMKNYKKVGK